MPYRSESTAHLIRRIFHGFRQQLDQSPARLPLTHAQASVLFFIRRAEHEGRQVSPSDLENGLHLSRPTVTGLLQRLESRGFLTSAPDETDKRFKRLNTTALFEKHHHLMELSFKEQERKLLEGFTPEEERQLNSFLTRMIRNLEEGEDAT